MFTSVPIIKAEEVTSSGRMYSFESIKKALDKIKWDTAIPVRALDREGNDKEIAYLKKPDFELDTKNKTLVVKINDSLKGKVMGRSLAPYVFIDRTRPKDKNSVIIEDFTLNGVQVTSDLCSFKSISSIVS